MDTNYSSINIIKGCIVVTVPNDLYGDIIQDIKKILLKKISENKVVGVVFDFSGLKLIDSYEYQELTSVIKMTKLLGSEAVVAGIQPGLVNAFLDLNVDVNHLKAFLNLEAGFEYFSDKMNLNANDEIEIPGNSVDKHIEPD